MDNDPALLLALRSLMAGNGSDVVAAAKKALLVTLERLAEGHTTEETD